MSACEDACAARIKGAPPQCAACRLDGATFPEVYVVAADETPEYACRPTFRPVAECRAVCVVPLSD